MSNIEKRVSYVKKLLHLIDVPVYRKDVSRPANVRWLLRFSGKVNPKLRRELVLLQKEFSLWARR